MTGKANVSRASTVSDKARRRSSILAVVKAAATLAAATKDKDKDGEGNRFLIAVDILCRSDEIIDDKLLVSLVAQKEATQQTTLILEYIRQNELESDEEATSTIVGQNALGAFFAEKNSISKNSFQNEAFLFRKRNKLSNDFDVAHYSAVIHSKFSAEDIAALTIQVPKTVKNGIIVNKVIVEIQYEIVENEANSVLQLDDAERQTTHIKFETIGKDEAETPTKLAQACTSSPPKSRKKSPHRKKGIAKRRKISNLFYFGNTWIPGNTKRTICMGGECQLPGLPHQLPKWRRALRDAERREKSKLVQWSSSILSPLITSQSSSLGYCNAISNDKLPRDMQFPQAYIVDIMKLISQMKIDGSEEDSVPSVSNVLQRVAQLKADERDIKTVDTLTKDERDVAVGGSKAFRTRSKSRRFSFLLNKQTKQAEGNEDKNETLTFVKTLDNLAVSLPFESQFSQEYKHRSHQQQQFTSSGQHTNLYFNLFQKIYGSDSSSHLLDEPDKSFSLSPNQPGSLTSSAATSKVPSRPHTALPLQPSSLDKLWYSDDELVTEILQGANPSCLRLINRVPVWFSSAYEKMLRHSGAGNTAFSGEGVNTRSLSPTRLSSSNMAGSNRGESVFIPDSNPQGQIFRIKMKMFKNLCGSGLIKTESLLHKHAEEGRLFEIDYSFFKEILPHSSLTSSIGNENSKSDNNRDDELHQRGHTAASNSIHFQFPRALFYVQEVIEGSLRYLPKLIPLCIQCDEDGDLIFPGMGDQHEFQSDIGQQQQRRLQRQTRDSTNLNDLAVESGWGWASAKVRLMSMHAVSHIFMNLYLDCIMKVEPFAIALHRNIHHQHPIFMLLHPYVQFAIPTAVSARALWCNDDGDMLRVRGGAAQEDLHHSSVSGLLFGIKKEHILKMTKRMYSYQSMTMSTQDEKSDCENPSSKGKDEKQTKTQKLKTCRNVIDAFMCDKKWARKGMPSFTGRDSLTINSQSMIPSYPFREDSLLLWSCIVDHASSFVHCFYADDEQVINDHELQAFWKEALLHIYNVRDVESHCALQSPTDLRDLLAGLLYCSTVEFCAHTSQCWNSYSNPLLAPLSMRSRAPTRFEEAMQQSQQEFIDCLPKTATSLLGSAFMQLISMEQGLGKPLLSATWTVEQETLTVKHRHQEQNFLEYIRLHREFISSLEVVEEVICERNQSRSTPYQALLPSKMKRGMAT